MLKLTVAKINESLFSGEVAQVTCPGIMGEMTILPHHAPLATLLKKGNLRIVNENSEIIIIPIEDGMLEVGSNQATILL